jgi:Kelch motif protein
MYDPGTNQWRTSWETASTLAPLPQARGGMGKAVYLDGDFYIMGGLTDGGTAGAAPQVSNRVDIYDPLGNRWRLGAPMPAARFGIFPQSIAGRIYVPGGGIEAGPSESTIFDVYNAAGTMEP